MSALRWIWGTRDSWAYTAYLLMACAVGLAMQGEHAASWAFVIGGTLAITVYVCRDA